MGNIKIIKGVFDSSLELEHAEVAARFLAETIKKDKSEKSFR